MQYKAPCEQFITTPHSNYYLQQAYQISVQLFNHASFGLQPAQGAAFEFVKLKCWQWQQQHKGNLKHRTGLQEEQMPTLMNIGK